MINTSSSIHQEINIAASSKRVYDALTDSSQFSALTGANASIEPIAGGQFSSFGGMITGRTIEALPAERLVQAWRVSNWEAGVYSIARFQLLATGDHSCTVVFDHSGYPEGAQEHLEQGWHNKYWTPMIEFFAKSPA